MLGSGHQSVSHHLACWKPKTRAVAGERHQLHVARLAGLEAHGGAGGDVEAHGRAALARSNVQGGVGLGEMIVRADLDRPVAGVGDRERDRRRGRR